MRGSPPMWMYVNGNASWNSGRSFSSISVTTTGRWVFPPWAMSWGAHTVCHKDHWRAGARRP